MLCTVTITSPSLSLGCVAITPTTSKTQLQHLRYLQHPSLELLTLTGAVVFPSLLFQGSQKLLHWTAQDVKNWLWNINLDQYVGALDNVGLHGALMVSYFNVELLAAH